MSRKIIYGFILLMVVTISCNVTNTSTEGAFEVRGTEGLSIKLRDDNIPDKIVVDKDRPIKFVLELANKGGYDSEIANLNTLTFAYYLSGFDRSIIANLDHNKFVQDKYLEKISEFNPKGGSDIMELEGAILYDSILEGTYKPKINFNFCYEYLTRVSVPVCIDPDIYDDTRSKKVCQVKAVNLDSQGAPIAVKSVVPEVFSDSMLFRIKIQNVGGGQVVDVTGNNVLKCANAINTFKTKDFGLVRKEVFQISGKSLECTPLIGGNKIRLHNGVGEIECRIKLSELTTGGDSFLTPLELNLGYTYRQTFDKQLNIVKVPK